MKGKHCLFLLLILGALLACNDPKPVTDALHRAEALMNEHPDSAWAVLNTLSPDEMGQNRTRALYALLYTQAQDKTYRDETNDSLISIAVDYYRHTDDARRKFLSYYYKGRVMMNARESIKAMLSFLEAENLCEEINDGYLLGLLYTQIGDIYKNHYDYPRSLEMFKKATVCYEQSGKDLHRLYSLVDQASVYKNLGRNEESYRLHQIVLDEGTRKGYRGLTELCLGDLTMLCLKMKKLDEADLFIRELQQHYDISTMSSSFLADVAEIHAIRKEWNLSQEVLQQAWQRAQTENDTIVLYFAEARIHEIRNPQSDTYYSMLEGLKKQASSLRKSMEQPVLTVQNDLLTTKLEYHQYKLRMEKCLRLLYILLFSLVIVMVVYVLSRKLKKEKEKARKTIDELNCEILHRDRESRHKIASLLEELEEQDKSASASIQGLRSELQRQEEDYHRYIKEAEEMQKNLNTKFMQHSERSADFFRRTNSIMSELYLVFREKKVSALGIGRVVHKWEDEYWIGKKALIRLEELLDFYYNDVMYHFRQEVDLGDEVNYRRVCYWFAGVSVKAVAVLMKENKETIYQRRLRLREKIEDSEYIYKDLYLDLLGK